MASHRNMSAGACTWDGRGAGSIYTNIASGHGVQCPLAPQSATSLHVKYAGDVLSIQSYQVVASCRDQGTNFNVKC